MVSQGLVGAMLVNESFSDLDYADDAAIFSELCTVPFFGLKILSLEAPMVGLKVNWMKTKIQSFDTVTLVPPSLMIGTQDVNLVMSFTYLRVMIISEPGHSSSEIRRHIEISRSLFN